MSGREYVEITFKGDSSSAVRAATTARAAIESLDDSTVSYHVSMGEASKKTDSATASLSRFNVGAMGLRNALGLLKLPALVAGFGMLTQAALAAGAGVVGLTGAIGPLVGAATGAVSAMGGLAQAMGVGLAAFAGVGEATKALGAAHTSMASDAEAASDRVAGAAQQIEDAEQSVAATQEAAQEAQEALTQAREDAREKLIQLRFAAEGAAISEKRAQMALNEAMRAQRDVAQDAMSTASERRDAALSVQEAELSLAEARHETKTSQEELNEAEQKGIRGSDEMVQARDNLQNAQQQVTDATQGLVAAQEAMNDATTQGSSATDNLAEAMANLSPVQRDFAKYLYSLKPMLEDVQATAAEGLLPGVQSGIQDAIKNFDVLNGVVRVTARTMGRTAEDMGELLGSGPFGRDFAVIGRRNADVLDAMGDVSINLASALRHVMVAADPLIEWMADGLRGWGEWINKTAQVNRANGDMADFFDKTKDAMKDWGAIIQSVGAGLYEVFKGASPLGRDIINSWVRGAEGFERWAESARGGREIAAFFQRMKPTVYEIGRLVRDLGAALFDIGDEPGTAKLIRQLRTELLPVLTDVTKGVTRAFGPAMIDAITEFSQLFATLVMPNTGVITLTVKGLTAMASLLNTMFEKIPGLGEFASVLFTVGGFVKLFSGGLLAKGIAGIGTAITGLLTNPATPAAITNAGQRVASSYKGGFLGALTGAGGITAGIMLTMAATTRGGIINTIQGRGAVAGEVFAEGFIEKYQGVLEEGLKKASRGQALELPGGVEISTQGDYEGAIDDLQKMRDLFESMDGGLPPEMEASLDSMIKTLGKAGEASEEYRQIVNGNNRAMERGFFNSTRAINSAIDRNIEKIQEEWPRGSEKGRKEMAETYRAAAENVDKLVQRQIISTKEGEERKAELIRTSKVVVATEETARKYATQWAKGMDSSKDFTGKGVEEIVAELKKMPPESRKVAQATWLSQLKIAAQNNPKLKDEFRELRSKIIEEFGYVKTKGSKYAEDFMQSVGGSFFNLSRNVGKAVGNIGQNSNEILKSIGADELKYNIKTIASGIGTAKKALGLQQGGAIVPGVGEGDKVPLHLAGRHVADVEPGELVSVANRDYTKKLMEGNSLHPRQKLAGGGIVPVPGFPGEFAARSILDEIAEVHSTWPSLVLTDAYGQGHSSVGHTVFGTAADFSGPDTAMDEAVKALVQQGYLVGYDGRFGSEAWAGHGPSYVTPNFHFHVEFGQSGGSLNLKGAEQVEKLKQQLLLGPDSPLKRGSQATIDETRREAQKYINKEAAAIMSTMVPGGGGIISGDGDVERVFAQIARKKSRSKTATLALGEAGYAESGMRDLSYGDASSQGALQLLASTAAGLGVSPHDEGAIASLFFDRGFFGKGGANALAAQGLAAHQVAQDVQGSGAGLASHGASNYLPQKANAQAWMGRYGLQEGGVVMLARGKGKGGKDGKIQGPPSGLKPTQSNIEGLYSKLGKIDNEKRQSKIEKTIKALRNRLAHKTKIQDKKQLNKIDARGSMKDWAEQINAAQDDVDQIDDTLVRLGVQHDLTDIAGYEDILRDWGLDPDDSEFDLSDLSPEQQNDLVAAIDAEYSREEREVTEEMSAQYQLLDRLLNLRKQLIDAIAVAEKRRLAAVDAMEKAARKEKKAKKEEKDLEGDIKDLSKRLVDLRNDKPRERGKNESAKDYNKRLKDWRQKNKERMADVGIKMDSKRFLLGRAKQEGAFWRQAQGLSKENITELADWKVETQGTLDDIQGKGSTGAPVNITTIGPLPTSGVSQFGGRILETQAALQSLGATEFIRPTFDFKADDSGDDNKDLLISQLQELNLRSRQAERLAEMQLATFQGFASEFGGLPYVGAYATGTDYVPQTGMALVHKGERITPADQNVAGAGGVTINLYGDLAAAIRAEMQGEGARVADQTIGRNARRISFAPGRA